LLSLAPVYKFVPQSWHVKILTFKSPGNQGPLKFAFIEKSITLNGGCLKRHPTYLIKLVCTVVVEPELPKNLEEELIK
jgi:hypothetical protein